MWQECVTILAISGADMPLEAHKVTFVSVMWTEHQDSAIRGRISKRAPRLLLYANSPVGHNTLGVLPPTVGSLPCAIATVG